MLGNLGRNRPRLSEIRLDAALSGPCWARIAANNLGNFGRVIKDVIRKWKRGLGTGLVEAEAKIAQTKHFHTTDSIGIENTSSVLSRETHLLRCVSRLASSQLCFVAQHSYIDVLLD